MAENNVDTEPEWNERALDMAEDTLVAMETLLATLKAFEDVLRQQEISTASSTEYCDNFCQVMCIVVAPGAIVSLLLARQESFSHVSLAPRSCLRNITEVEFLNVCT